ncbi:C-type lectin domain family 2 member B-like isoform X1 [Aquarana catesbeiana]|uniref:C-type lectin domain family 2 member B-like isoform X1 n=1 Tax=Aquarana catesbeiana TaxID=8400 RepID=UPI003CC978B1
MYNNVCNLNIRQKNKPKAQRKISPSQGQVLQFLMVLLIFLFFMAFLSTSLLFTFYFNMTNKLTEINATMNNILANGTAGLLCGKDWKFYNLSCYYKSTIAQSWDSAKEDCKKMKADLVIINGDDEMNFLNKFSNNQDWWIGLGEVKPGDLVDRTSHNTTWFNNGTSQDLKGEDCNHFKHGTGLTNGSCSQHHKYICEKRLP